MENTWRGERGVQDVNAWIWELGASIYTSREIGHGKFLNIGNRVIMCGKAIGWRNLALNWVSHLAWRLTDFLRQFSIGISLSNLRGRNCCHSAHIIIIGVSCSLRAVIRIKGFYRSCVPWGYRVGIFNYMLACMTLVGFDFWWCKQACWF